MPSSKWESDRDEVEVDYQRMDGPQPPKPSIFSGRKGMLLKAMIFSVIFLLGLIIGYALRRNVQEKFIHARVCAYRDGYQVSWQGGYNQTEAMSLCVCLFICSLVCIRALCRIKLMPVTHVLMDTWMLTVKPAYKLSNVPDDLK